LACRDVSNLLAFKKIIAENTLSMSAANPSCPQCGSLKTKLKYFQEGLARGQTARSFAPHLPPRSVFPYRFWHCLNCDLCFNTAALNAGPLAALAPDALLRNPSWSAMTAQTYLKLLRPYLAQHGRFLDIGCGDAAFLNLLQGEFAYLELYGLQLAPSAVGGPTAAFRAQITAEPWAKELYPAHYFDYIMLAQTIEHLPHLWDKMRDLLYWLRPGGKLIIFTHNYHSLVNRLLGQRSPIYDAQHGQLYSPKSLRHLGAGLKTIVLQSYLNYYPAPYLWALAQASFPGLQRFSFPEDLSTLKLPLPAGNILAIFEQTSLLHPYRPGQPLAI
jgi:SAM-dependent methyltransferase